MQSRIGGLVAALLLLIPAAAARAEEAPGFHVGVLAGLGMRYGVAGANIELRYSHVSLAIGTGAASAMLGMTAINLGLRAFLGNGDGFFLSVHGAPDVIGTPDAILVEQRAILVGATVGYRFRWTCFLIDVGIGGGYARERTVGKDLPLPDLDLALGWEF